MTETTPSPDSPTIAQHVVEALRLAGCGSLYCLPGVQNDDFFDTLFDADDITPIVTRHEQGAAYMAFGAAQVTGRPAACSVVPGPGLLNAGAALTSAYWANARVLALVGEIPTFARGKAFGLLHELPDQHAVLGQLTKHAALLDDPEHAVADLQVALDQVSGGRPRPVSVEVPVNRWRSHADGALAAPGPIGPTIDEEALDRAVSAIRSAERPLIFVGGGAQDASAEVQELAELLQAPVTTRRMGHGVVPTGHPLFAHVTMGHRLWENADVVIGIGSRMEWPLLQWGTDDDQTIIKIDIDAAELDRHGVGTIGVAGDAAEVCRLLVDAFAADGRRPDRTDEVASLRHQFEEERARLQPQLAYLAAIRDVLPDDGVLVEDVTQLGFASHLGFDFRGPRTFLSSGAAGTLGAGYAHALGAQHAVQPTGRKVVAVCGDGGFLFTGSELATAVQHGINLVAIVVADGAYGNVKRMQQQKFGDDRTIASTLRNPDFAAYARSFGAVGMNAADPDEVRSCLDEAFSLDQPVIIEVAAGPMPDPWPLLIRPRVRGVR